MKENQFFHIEPKLIEGKTLFPFHLYVYNPMTREYNTYLWGNDPLVKRKKEILDFIVEKGGSIAVKLEQKKTFLISMDLKEDDIPSLLEATANQDGKSQSGAKKRLSELEEKTGTYNLKMGLKKSMATQDFKEMIERARVELEALSVRVSHTVSLARYLSSTLLFADNLVNRVVAVSYFLAKNCDIKEDEGIGDLICAAFFHHLGATQIDTEVWTTPTQDHFESDRKAYRKHPGLSDHLIRKSGIELSKRCKKIINEHHERHNGGGYPNEKKGDHLDILSLILGAVGHLLEYSSGKITGTEKPLETIITSIKENSPLKGLEYSFGPLVEDNLANLLVPGSYDENASVFSDEYEDGLAKNAA